MPGPAHGEGSITRRKGGLWQAALQLDGNRQVVYGATRQEAADRLRTLQGVARENGRLPTCGNLTLGDIAQWQSIEEAAGIARQPSP